jgi:hypothetical protein
MSNQAYASAVRAATLVGDDNKKVPGQSRREGVLDVTAVPGVDTVQLVIENKDPVSGKYVAVLAAARARRRGTDTLTVYPGGAVAANVGGRTTRSLGRHVPRPGDRDALGDVAKRISPTRDAERVEPEAQHRGASEQHGEDQKRQQRPHLGRSGHLQRRPGEHGARGTSPARRSRSGCGTCAASCRGCELRVGGKDYSWPFHDLVEFSDGLQDVLAETERLVPTNAVRPTDKTFMQLEACACRTRSSTTATCTQRREVRELRDEG